MVKNKKFRFALFLLSTLGLMACSKVKKEPDPYYKYESGEVIEISKASGGINSFMLRIEKADDSQVEAIIDDTSQINRFEKGDLITLYGLQKGGIFLTNNIISTNSKSFVLKANILSIKHNKDGYKAIAKDANEMEYDLIFSIPNMGDQFKIYETGDSIYISGELWTMRNKAIVTVRSVNN